MKKLYCEITRYGLACLFILWVSIAQAATYYFSSSQGDDSRSMQQAQNPATPWRSIDKLNAIFASLSAGDVISFNRGETFEGTINITKSGASGSPITFTAHGSGARPVISSFGVVGSWSSVGNGVWEARFSTEATTLNMVTINNVAYAMGRFPNSDAPNKGYLNMESFVWNTQLTDNELPSSPNWTGAEVVIRKNRWIIDRNIITNHSGTTISYNTGSFYPGGNKNGYFIQNHPATLDRFGEWYYNKAAGTLRVFFGSNNPSSYQVRASSREIGVKLNNNSYVTFDGLALQGSNRKIISIENTTGISIINSEIAFAGTDAISGMNTKNFKLENSVIEYVYNNGIDLPSNCPNTTIRNNQVSQTGYFAGMGRSGDFTYHTIYVIGENALIENNRIEYSGYVPIRFGGTNSIIRNNFINFHNYVKDDGGAIYTWNNASNAVTFTQQKVLNNIVMNGLGAPEGTSYPNIRLAKGIYMDDNSANVEIAGNTITGCSKGIYIHNSYLINIHDNIFFDNRDQQALFEHDNIAPTKPIRNILFRNNILASKDPGQQMMGLYSKDHDIAQFGTYDNNFYTRTIVGNVESVTTIGGQWTSSQVKTVHNLSRWKAALNFEAGSKEPKMGPHYKINNLIGANKSPNKTFDAGTNGAWVWATAGNMKTEWDNTNKLDGGSLKVYFTHIASQTGSGLINFNIGAIDKSKKYIVKFSSVSAIADRTIKMSMMQSGAPYQMVTTKTFKSTNTRSDYEFLVEPANTIDQTLLRFEMGDPDGTVWFDNVEVFEADVALDPEHIRLEYNASNTAKTISLNGITYLNGKGEIKTGSITLAPFTSELLIKQAPGDFTSVAPLELNSSSKNITCNGMSNGAASVTVTGGVAPYTYTWSTGQTTAAVEGLAAGNYTVTVTDKAGTKKTASFTLTQPSAISLSEVVVNETAKGNDGSIVMSVSGGTSAYSYKWSTGATTKDLSGLSAGSYTLTVTDANNCSASKTVVITKSEASALILEVTTSDITCNGVKDGRATATVTGGVAPYSYTWSGGQTTAAVEGLAAGNYTVTVTDKEGNKQSKTVSIIQPYSITLAENVVHESLAGNDGSIAVTTSGGTGAYSYKWSTGATSKDLSGLSAGSYTLTVTDANNCAASLTAIVKKTPTAPIVLTYTSREIICNGSSTGTIALTVTGGIAPYTYAWSNGKTTAQVSDLSAGNYTVIVTDAEGTSQTKIIDINEPSAIVVTETLTNESAKGNDGSIAVTISGGTGAYSYKWSTGATTKDLSGLSAGSYTLTVTDANNCQAAITVVLSKTIEPTVVNPLSLNSSFKNITCNGMSNGAASVTVTGGVAPYTYTWSTGQTTAAVEGLAAGNYTVTVTDKAGTKKTASFTLTQPSAISLSEVVVNETAKGNDGSIVMNVSGGTSAYSYKWSTGATSKDLSGLSAGSYTLTVTDANNCAVNKTVVVRANSTQLPSIQSFTLLNGERNNVIAKHNPIKDQDTIDLASLPTRILNIRANTSNNDVGSIIFGLNGQSRYSVDESSPFYLINGSSSWMPQPGTYTLTATPYSKNNTIGAGVPLTITFYIVDKPVPTAEKYLPVEPVLNCVQDNGNGTLTAHFGYINENKKAVSIASGKENSLSVIPLQGQVIEQFEPGKHDKVFSVVFASTSILTWSLTGPDGKEKRVTVSSMTQFCEPTVDMLIPRIVFSPNEDGIDDMWKIENIEKYPNYEVIVFNRNGSKVFQTKNYSNNWDGRFQGRPLLAEAYYYVIKNNKENIKTGTVTIVR